jgi:hypothetical protein
MQLPNSLIIELQIKFRKPGTENSLIINTKLNYVDFVILADAKDLLE